MLSRRQLMLSLAALGGGLACRRSPGRPSPQLPLSHEPADLLILGRVHTNDPDQPAAEAVAIRGGVVVGVGPREVVEGRRGPDTRVLDLDGGAALPGLTDAHAHLLGLGQSREIVDLRGAASVDEVLRRLEAGAPERGWILGRGWDQNLWGGAMPSKAALDARFGDRPVWLRRIDGHAGWASSAVLALAKITASTANPEGGEILRDDQGEATGVLVDAAMELVPVPPPSRADVERWLRAATSEAASLGLTGVHEMGLGVDAHAVFSALADAGELPLRVHGYASEGWWLAERDMIVVPGRPVPATARYVLAGVKVYVDGALGSRGAALLEPYADRPEHRGALMHELDYFVEIAADALERGVQVAAHAIGDRGNRTIIEAYARALARVPEADDPRLRVEHVQVIDPADIARMAELGLVASMQPTHATSDMPWAPARLGAERLAGAYAWQRMRSAGVPLAFGSDFPVEQPSPLLGLYAAITRQDLDGQPEGGWLPDQRLELGDAVAAFSSGAAYAGHREDQLGVIKPGYRADLTCLAGDPFAVEPRALVDLEVRATVVDGELTYEG